MHAYIYTNTYIPGTKNVSETKKNESETNVEVDPYDCKYAGAIVKSKFQALLRIHLHPYLVFDHMCDFYLQALEKLNKDRQVQ